MLGAIATIGSTVVGGVVGMLGANARKDAQQEAEQRAYDFAIQDREDKQAHELELARLKQEQTAMLAAKAPQIMFFGIGGLAFLLSLGLVFKRKPSRKKKK